PPSGRPAQERLLDHSGDATPVEARALDAIARGDMAEFSEALGLGLAGADKFRAFEVLRRAYRRIARDTLVVLAAHDLQRADGLPMHVAEVIRLWANDGTLFFSAAAEAWCVGEVSEIVLPPSAAELFEARFSQSDPEQIDLLRTAAVIGDEFVFDLLVAVDGR